MTDPPQVNDDHEFEEALSALIKEAQNNGVDFEGGWKCRIEDGDEIRYLDVQITPVEYLDD